MSGDPAAPTVEIHDLRVEKGGRRICEISTLTILRGDRVGILGANGSGKSTLLRLLGGLENDFCGRLDCAVPQRDRVYVHQSPIMFSGTVLRNVEYGLVSRGLRPTQRKEMARHWLDKFGIIDLHNRDAASLSGGERRRVALARACAVKPGLLLLDEPFADLDREGIECLRQALASLDRVTIIIASPAALPENLVNRSVQLNLKKEPH